MSGANNDRSDPVARRSVDRAVLGLRLRRLLLALAVLVATLTSVAAMTPAQAVGDELTVTVDVLCSDYGFDVTNTSDVTHAVVLTVNGTAQPPVAVDPGKTVHLAVDVHTPAATPYTLTDNDGTTLASGAFRFCVTVENLTVSIRSGTSYTVPNLESGAAMAPAPQHGTLTRTAHSVRYTPDACFVGTDRFGYSDSVGAVQGVVTVHVVGPACAPTPTPSPTSPALLANTGMRTAALGGGGALAIMLGVLLLAFGRRSRAPSR